MLKITKYCDTCGKIVKKDDEFCIYCGQNLSLKEETPPNKRGKKSIGNTLLVVGVIAIVLLFTTIVVIGNTGDESGVKEGNFVQGQQESIESKNIRSVVNIICDNEYSGSGTVFSEDGDVLTNNHVVEGATYCFVTIPDSDTGEPLEIYEANPVIIPELSEKYDIALLKIVGLYFDEDGYSWGTYPNSFIAFQAPPGCSDIPSKLGDSVRIFGYPSTSHNYNLTVTDGVISNFDFESGYILTSAKVDSGNSGGLAIDQYGCFVGIPSAVLTGDYQNFGVLIPSHVITEFFDEVSYEATSSGIKK